MPVQVNSLLRCAGVALLALFVLGGAACAQPADAARDGFTLRNQLGLVWSNEAVRFPVSLAQLEKANAG